MLDDFPALAWLQMRQIEASRQLRELKTHVDHECLERHINRFIATQQHVLNDLEQQLLQRFDGQIPLMILEVISSLEERLRVLARNHDRGYYLDATRANSPVSLRHMAETIAELDALSQITEA